MPSKLQAEATEAQLLGTFDYAWNKGCNGPRRPADIILKLDKFSSSTAFLDRLLRKLRTFHQRPVGIGIEPLDPPRLQSDRTPRVIKMSRSCPRPVSATSGAGGGHWPYLAVCGVETAEKHADVAVCGAAVDGATCRAPPAEGRKRCTEHKGMRLRLRGATAGPGRKGGGGEMGVKMCSVVGADGSTCIHTPLPGRKRCGAHKGMRVRPETRVSPTDPS